MKVMIETALGTHWRDVVTFEGILSLMQEMKSKWRFQDNDWVGA